VLSSGGCVRCGLRAGFALTCLSMGCLITTSCRCLVTLVGRPAPTPSPPGAEARHGGRRAPVPPSFLQKCCVKPQKRESRYLISFVRLLKYAALLHGVRGFSLRLHRCRPLWAA